MRHRLPTVYFASALGAYAQGAPVQVVFDLSTETQATAHDARKIFAEGRTAS